VQDPYIGQTIVFDIEDHDFRPVFGDALAKFIPGTRHMYRVEVGGKFTGQRLGNPGMTFENYDA
jgi:hypothetical protein